jgi:glycosyltransferase involved in cell wall biosynthesis
LVSDQLVGYHKSWSGAELVLKQAAESLLRQNQKVVFITTEFAKKYKSRDILQIPTVNTESKILKLAKAPLFRMLGIAYSFFYLKKEKPDIVHFFHSNYLSIPAMISAYILKIPTVFTVLDYFIICPRNNLRLDNGKICASREGFRCLKCVSSSKFSEKFIIRLFFKNLNGIITFTKTSQSRLVKHGIPQDKIKIIYTYDPPIISEDKRKMTVTSPNSILFVGTFFEYKGLHVLIKAMRQIVDKVPDSKLIIVGLGGGKDKTRIEKLVYDLGIENHVVFLGQKRNEEVSEEILKSEVVAVPEQWPSDFGPLILVEAMALGKPVVASNIGAIPEFIKDGKNGFLAGHNQPAEFAEKIMNLLLNKSFAKSLGERAQKDIKYFLSDNREKKAIDFYEEIIFKFKHRAIKQNGKIHKGTN